MKLADLFKSEISLVLSEVGFLLKEDGGGYLAVKDYELGDKIIFFEVSKKEKDSFRVGISIRVTNIAVQKIYSIVNSKNASKSTLSFRLSHLASRYNKRELNFERKKFDGISGDVVSKELLPRYINNLKSCLQELISPFFDRFTNQNSFHEWLNIPVLDGHYNFDIGATWKDAISSVIIAKLVCSDEIAQLYKIWLNQDLPKGMGFDTRSELLELKKVLSLDQLA